MTIITDSLIFAFVGLLYFQRADGVPERLPANEIYVNMWDSSLYNNIILEGIYEGNVRRLPHWMRSPENLFQAIFVYILLENGNHFESILNPTDGPEIDRPYRPRYAELHILHDESHLYFTTVGFFWHDVVRKQPPVTGNPSESRIYIRMRGGTVYTSILNKYVPIEEKPTLIVHEEVSTSQPHKKIRKE